MEAIPEEPSSEAMRKSPRTEALLRQTYALFGEYAEQASGVPEEVVATVMDSRDPGFLADYIAQNIALRYTDKQEILEEFSPFARLRKLNGFLVRENNVLGFEHEMESKVRGPAGPHPAGPRILPHPRSGSSRTSWGRPMTATRTRLNPTARRSWPWSCRRRRSSTC